MKYSPLPLIALMFLWGTTVEISGQGEFRSDATRPHAFVSFEKVELNPRNPELSMVFLRFTNNTPWAIRTCVQGWRPGGKNVEIGGGRTVRALVNGRDAHLCYGVESYQSFGSDLGADVRNARGRRRAQNHVAQTAPPFPLFVDAGIPDRDRWIAPSESVLFQVPAKYLRHNRKIFLQFWYEWDVDGSTESMVNGPEHRCYFADYQLENALERLKRESSGSGKGSN